MSEEPKWLAWARQLQGLAQSGLTWSENPFHRERFEQVRAIAAEMMAAHSGAEVEKVIELFSAESGYATPKVDVRGVVFEGGKVLLVRERVDGKWTLPGGWADVWDTPSEAAVREVFEESGYRTRPVKLLALWDRVRQGHQPPRPFRIYKVFIQCEVIGGGPADSLETDGAAFFAEDALPELSLARTTPRQLARLFEHLRHPEWPADFD